jgi:hypothetical protein
MEKNKKSKKAYSRPEIIYERKIEALAGVCNSTWTGPSGSCCMKASCIKRAS